MKYPIIAQRLKEAMADKDMKAVELSLRSGVLKSSISQYMNGTHSITNVKAGAIAEVLGVNPVWLMGFDVPKYVADEKSQQDKYYLNDETAKRAQKLFDDPYIHALLDAAEGSKPENITMVAELLNRLKGTNIDG